MSNKLPNGKVLDMGAMSQQKQDLDLKRQSFIVNTRLRLAETYLGVLLSRADVNFEQEGMKDALVEMALDYANGLMIAMGITIKQPVE